MLKSKEIEKLAIKKYLDVTGQSFEISEYESPDFILRGLDIEIGCEVTEYYPDYGPKGSELRKRESYLKQLHVRIRIMLIEKYPIGYRFSIIYKPKATKRSSIDAEVTSVDLAMNHNLKSQIIVNPSISISQIQIEQLNDLPTQAELLVYSDFLQNDKKSLEQIIEVKTGLSKKWNNRYKYKWLIISFGVSISGDVRFDLIKDLDKVKDNYWDKIVLIDINFGNYKEINAT